MWTPWRMTLLLLGLAASLAAYYGYSHLLGSLDGLPSLPERYRPDAQPSLATARAPVESPTVQKLQLAFGVGSVEAVDTIVYKTKVQLPDRGLVIAAGLIEFNPNGSTRVEVSPISLAVFGQGKPLPKEVPEISTFHADRAVLHFNQNVSRLQDISSDKAKLVGVELTSTSSPGINPIATSDFGGDDRRKGYIWITNNQRSADTTEHIVARTTGPVIYQVPDETVPYNPDVANVWTAHPVEVFDRKNLPRTFRFAAPKPDSRRRYAVNDILDNVPPVAGIARPEDLHRRSAVADILHGEVLPPPTISAVGMKIYLAPPENKNASRTTGPTPAGEKKEATSGIRQLVFCEKVQMNLWTEGGFPGEQETDSKSAHGGTQKPNTDPPLALAAISGALSDGAAVRERIRKKSLLLIETPGAFRYDFEKEEARFDSAPQPLPAGQANCVTVSRLNAIGEPDHLYCSSLTLDLSSPPNPTTGTTANSTTPRPRNESARNGRGIRALVARGEVLVHIESEKLTAQGAELHYRRDLPDGRTSTVLQGKPVQARSGQNWMQAGSETNEATVVIDTIDTPPTPNQPSKRTSTIAVRGPGLLELYDPPSGKDNEQHDTVAARAKWGKSLTHIKDRLGGKEVDLFKFDGGGAFIDPRSDFTLKADLIRLWLASKNESTADSPTRNSTGPADTKNASGGGARPERLQADGNVDVRSPELVVQQTDRLNVFFRDVPPPRFHEQPATEGTKPGQPLVIIDDKPMPDPKIAVAPPTGSRRPDAETTVPGTPMKPLPATTPPREDPPVPIYLSARIIDSWVVRYPVAASTTPLAGGKQPEPLAITPVKAEAQPGSNTSPARPAVAPTKNTKLKYDLEQAICEDRVHVQQEPTDPGQTMPGMDIRGNRLNLKHSTAGSEARIFGTIQNFASVQYEGLTLFGPEIFIDQPNNAVDVKGPGRLKLLSDADFNGNKLDTPSDLVITWTRQMQFWGAKAMAEFVGNVSTQQVVLPTPKAAVPAAGRPGGPNLPAVEAPAPKEVGDPNPNTTRYVILSHRLDLTFDKPVYFNQLSKKKEKTPGTASSSAGVVAKTGPAAKAGERPKLKTATATPIPDDEAREVANLPHTAHNVFFFEEVFRPDRTYAQARILTSRQIDFANREKEQDLKATGPGELRLLQPGSANDDLTATPAKPNATAAEEDQEMKLTVVTFPKRMNAKDQAKIYQEASFPDGATVIRIPTTNPRLEVEPHNLPPDGIMLDSDKSLVVSSSKPGKGAKPETRLVATGNAHFKDKKYEGNGTTITYTNQAVVFEGTEKRLATLYQRKLGVNNRQYHQAQQIIYKKDGTVTGTGAGAAQFSPGG